MNLVEQEVKKAQHEFDEITGAAVLFLNKNGMEIEFIRKMLHNTLNEIIDNYKEFIERGSRSDRKA
jgi:hypothetical protein